MVECISIVLGILLAQPTWHQDVKETPEQRAELIRPVAVAVCTVTDNWRKRLYLMAQSYAETRYARYVLEERCKDGPKGARCDEGLARGPWQNHRHCRAAWKAPTLQGRYIGGARCALYLYDIGLRRCGTLEGAFYSNSGRHGCRAAWARRRVRLMARMEAKLNADPP